MSDAQISHEHLEQYVAALVEARDEATADAEKNADHPVVARAHRETEAAFRLALAFLHIWSDGAYGQSGKAQRGQVTR